MFAEPRYFGAEFLSWCGILKTVQYDPTSFKSLNAQSIYRMCQNRHVTAYDILIK
jgi:hypothetical protein